MGALEMHSHAGCSWIVDQLIAIRDLEHRLIEALASSDQRSSMRLRSRLAELDRRVDTLDRTLDAFAPAAEQDRVAAQPIRCIGLSERLARDAGRSPRHARRESLLQRTG